MQEYVNDGRRHGMKYTAHNEKADRRLLAPLFLSFGLLCVIQAILNISLNVVYRSSMTSTCNLSQVGSRPTTAPKVVVDCEGTRHQQCNELQERFNALTADKNLLEDTNNRLNNRIMLLEEDVKRLQINIRELSTSVSSQGCPSGWREIDSRCYFLSTETKTWDDSRRDCKSKNADLVVINGEQEQRAIYQLDGDVYLLFWIGLHCTNGKFHWVDGSALTIRFWQDGQPSDSGPNNPEDCVEMYHHNPPLSSWNDAPCAAKRRWMCERTLT